MLPSILPSLSMRFCSMESVSILCEEAMRLSRVLRSACVLVAGFFPQETSSSMIRHHNVAVGICRWLYIDSKFCLCFVVVFCKNSENIAKYEEESDNFIQKNTKPHPRPLPRREGSDVI